MNTVTSINVSSTGARKPIVPAMLVTPPEFLSDAQCKALLDICASSTRGGGATVLSIDSIWRGGVRWSRNRVDLSSDVRQTIVRITRTIRGAEGNATTTRLDADGLRTAVAYAEQTMLFDQESFDTRPRARVIEPIDQSPVLWSDATYRLDANARGHLVRALADPAEAAGYLSAGELSVAAQGNAVVSADGMTRYFPSTTINLSSTVRDAKGTASGWAGVTDFDAARIDMVALGARALDKSIRSANPVAVEPGRYTAILEPQAVADLLSPLVLHGMDRQNAERGRGPFAGPRPGTSKIGQMVLDPRLTLSADPMDPLGGFAPYMWFNGEPYHPVHWIEQGQLRELAYQRWYGVSQLGVSHGLPNSQSFRLSGGTATVDEMIASTDRGVLVTRLSGVNVVDDRSYLCTGYTRDGLWLIEHGKMTKSLKNFRFTESPLFAFNNVEALGVPRRVFCGKQLHPVAWVVPPLKVRDFSFTSVADAV